MKETDLPEPDIYYSATKVASTMICRAISIEKALPVVTVRPFSVYGNGELEHRFIPTIIRNAKEGSTMNLAPGVHDWVYVEDVVRGMYIVAQHGIELSGQVVNLGTGRQMTNEEVVQSISYSMDRAVKTNEVGLMRYWDYQKLWKADNTKAKSLGIQFRTFEQGIADMLKEQGYKP
jgi:nucleoside-diphosphate-sugar epimerase